MKDGNLPPAPNVAKSAAVVATGSPTQDDFILTRRQLVQWGILIEVATLAVAIGLAYLTGEYFWKEIVFDDSGIAVGCLAVLPMMAVFLKAHELSELVRKLLGPALAQASLVELLVLAAFAGLCEEALFRGVLEPWLANAHWFVGFFGANLLFGLAHAATRNYFLLAMAFGMYLSLLNWGIGEPNLLRAIACHALYDFLAFLWLARLQRREESGRTR